MARVLHHRYGSLDGISLHRSTQRGVVEPVTDVNSSDIPCNHSNCSPFGVCDRWGTVGSSSRSLFLTLETEQLYQQLSFRDPRPQAVCHSSVKRCRDGELC
jgi:hypothetical protein